MLSTPTTPWFKVSQLEVLVTRACDPSLLEPNYALHLEVADYINTKKANTPREASMLIARFANHRNPHISVLALSLIDTLVQTCGYPFHLQISTKEFLNELVRRFPERPPPFPGPVMSRILDLIHGWKEGICAESRWRDDLGNIRDMHRLLTFKGYRFRELPRQPDLSDSMNIKSADELEMEDREAQSAKLQELIRRGTPRDLAAAQELMKALAGANPDAKPDYRSQALTELSKLEAKVVLLNEMLDNVDTSRREKFASGDVYDQVANILESARPKLQKWISDAETDDPESLDTFLQMNDQINIVLDRFEAFKKGDYVTSSNPIPAELAGSSTRNELSLIDFDDSAPSHNSASGASSRPVDELADLFAAPVSASTPQVQYIPPSTKMYSPSPVAGMPPPVNSNSRPVPTSAPPSYSRSSGQASPQQHFGSIMLPGTPQPSGQAPARMVSPNYFSNNGGAPASRGPTIGASVNASMGSILDRRQQGQPLQAGASASTGNSAQGKDPFADLAGLF